MSNRVIAAVGVAFLLGACGVSKDEFAAAQKDAANAKKLYADEQQKSAALDKKVADLQAQPPGGPSHGHANRAAAAARRDAAVDGVSVRQFLCAG